MCRSIDKVISISSIRLRVDQWADVILDYMSEAIEGSRGRVCDLVCVSVCVIRL